MLNPLSFLARLKTQTDTLGDDVQQMLAARLELARLEVDLSLRQIKALAATLGVLGVGAMAGLGVLGVLGAEALQEWTGWSRTTALASVGGGLVLMSVVGALLAVQAFRRNFTGLRDSIAELREDAAWINEWRGR